MKFIRYIFFPFSIIYWVITSTRNKFYEWGIMKSSRFAVPIINVGNLSMGGTGKTPHVEYLIRLIKDDSKVATLSRGFGRVERGFKLADENSTALQIGDEPLQYFKKFGDQIKVSVEADRVLGAMDLFRHQPDIEVLLLDDAYQHRKIQPTLNILLSDINDPFYQDWILPVGNLRESRSGKSRADIVIFTKCEQFDTINKELLRKKAGLSASQQLFLSRIVYGEVVEFNAKPIEITKRNVILVSGIANPKPFENYIAENAKILKHFNFNDHHKFKSSELREIHDLFDKFTDQNPLILTTEKDAMRLMSKEFEKELEKYPWCYQTISVELDRKEVFNKLILEHVKENH